MCAYLYEEVRLWYQDEFYCGNEGVRERQQKREEYNGCQDEIKVLRIDEYSWGGGGVEGL